MTFFRVSFMAVGVFLGLMQGSNDLRAATATGAAPRLPVSIVSTIPALCSFVAAAVDGAGRVDCLLPPGASPHTFEPKPSDLKRLSQARAIVTAAREIDGWAMGLSNAPVWETGRWLPQSMRLAGDDGVHTHHHGQQQNAQPESANEAAMDPHFWLDPQALSVIAERLAKELCAIDPASCPRFEQNKKSLQQTLAQTQREGEAILAPYKNRGIVTLHGFLGYFARRFGLRIVGVIEPSPGKEATPRTLVALVKTMQKEHVRVLFSEPQLPHREVDAIAESTGAKVFELDPQGGRPGRMDYRELILWNARALAESLK